MALRIILLSHLGMNINIRRLDCVINFDLLAMLLYVRLFLTPR